jgi:putative sporulation protein YtaF
MHWLSIIGIGLAANLDNLGIGISFGTRSIKIPFLSNLIICILSMASAFLSITLGSFISSYIPHSIANISGGLLIILMGIWGMKDEITTRPQAHQKDKANELLSLLNNPSKADLDGNKILSWKESIALGIALALNCLASGFGAGVTGLSPLATTLSIGIFSLITVYFGVRTGQQIAQTWLGKFSNAIGSILLIMIGLYEIFI